jgi:hypothetical protein
MSVNSPRLKEHAHAFADSIQARARHLRDVFAIKEDFTAIRWDLPTNKAQQGRFTDPGRPHDGGDFATRYGQRNIIKYQSVGARKLTPRTSTKFAIVWLIYGSFLTLLTLSMRLNQP